MKDLNIKVECQMNFIYEEKDEFELNFTLNSHENSATLNVNWLLAIIYALNEACFGLERLPQIRNYKNDAQTRILNAEVSKKYWLPIRNHRNI